MIIRPLRKTEVKKAAHIVGMNYSEQYEKNATNEISAMFQKYVIQPQYVVAELKGEIIGLAGYTLSWMDYAMYTIFWVNVSPEHQGKGIGSALVKKVIDIIKKKDAKMILLVTDKPRFYAKRFKFKTFAKFECDPYQLMALQLKK